MSLAFDLPRVSDSPLARFDPRWKLAALATAAVLVALLRSAPAAAIALAAALGLAAFARLPRHWLATRLTWTALLLGLFLVWLPLLPDPDANSVDLWGLRLSIRGLERLGNVLGKTLAVVTLVLVLIGTAPWHDTLKAAQTLRVPSLVIQLLLMTIRFVDLFAEEFSRLRTALRVRGFRNRPNAHGWRTVGQVAGVLLVRGSERAERVSQAMRCRGFEGAFRVLHDFHTRWTDVAAWGIILLFAGSLLAWDVWQR